MKKLFSIFLSLLFIASAFAQTADNPNRLLVVKPNGSFKAFDIDRVQELMFKNVEGRVACDIDFTSCTLTSVQFDLYMDDACKSFLINVLPAVIAKQLENNPANAGDYLRMYNSPESNSDGLGFNLSGIELNPATEYAIVTVGIDEYNCDGEVCAAYFTTEAPAIVGNPQVTTTITSAGKSSIKASFSANADVKGFAAVIGVKGELQNQYEMFAPMMGFTNIGDMVKGWGANFNGNGTYSYEWTDLDPNTEYEIYVQAWDKKDNYATLQIVNVQTAAQGGDGVAQVTITAGDYVLAQWGDEMLPSQFFKFTPNDQSWRYRFGVYLESDYIKAKDEIIANLCSEPEMPMAYWWWFDEFSTDYQIDPNVTVMVVAAAQNAKGEWGPVNEFKYTTAATTSGKPAKVSSKNKTGISTRIVPTIKAKKGVRPVLQQVK